MRSRGVGLGLALGLALWGCRGGAGPAEPPAAAPRISLQPQRLDLGRGVQDEEMRGAVTVENRGAAGLEIGAIDASRFCSGRTDAAAIPPGGSTTLRVTCRSDLYGPLREGIDLRSNDPRLPTARLAIVAEIEPLLAFDVASVDLMMRFGEERAREVHVIGTRAAEAGPRLAAKAAADTEIIPLAEEPGQPRGYRVRCLGRHVGVNAGNIVVATGLDRPREIAIPYACKVRGTLEVSPTNPFFNLKVSGDKVVRLTVRSSQPSFEVASVRVLDGPFAARLAHAEDDGTYTVDVTVLNDRLPDDAHTAVGTLLIVSNDRAEPRKEVPLFGSGRINKVTPP